MRITKPMSILIDPETKQKLKEIVERRDSDMSKEIRRMIRREYEAEFGTSTPTKCEEVVNG